MAVQGAEVGDIAFIERLGEIRHHQIAINGIGAGGDPGAIAKEADLFFFRGAVGLLLIAALFDAEAAIGVTFGDVGDIEAAFDVDVGVVLAHPGKDVLDIEGHHFAQSWDFLLESRHRSVQEGLQQAAIQEAQFLGEPVATRKRLFDIKAIRAAWIKHEMEAQLDDEQGVLEQEPAQLAGVREAFVLAKEEGFEVSALRMSGASAGRALGLPVVDHGPIKEGKEGAILLNHGIMLKQSGHHRVVKESRRGYHSKKLLLWVEWVC